MLLSVDTNLYQHVDTKAWANELPMIVNRESRRCRFVSSTEHNRCNVSSATWRESWETLNFIQISCDAAQLQSDKSQFFFIPRLAKTNLQTTVQL